MAEKIDYLGGIYDEQKSGIARAVLLAAVIMAGCAQDAGQDQPSQPEAGVLTVNGAEDGSFYEAEVYDWPEAVADAAALTGIISAAEPDGTGTGSADNGTLEIDLETPEGEAFTADGKFLVVLKDAEDDSAPLKYKTFVRFTSGRAALKYSTMKTATDEPSVSLYTVTFHINGGSPADFTQQVQSGGKATLPAPPTREGYTFDGWYKDATYTTKWDFGPGNVTADITLYARRKPLTFAVLLMDMAADAAANTDKTYTLPSSSETYILAITPLTTANSPASVTIDGGGRVVTGSSTNRITVESGVTLTLKNITFKKVPFTAAAGGTLVLDDGAVVTGNAGAGVTVSGTSATAKGTLEMREGASITLNGGSGVLGAGVRLEGTGGEFTMDGGEISGNNDDCGGVAMTGTNNEFTMIGGGLCLDGSTLTGNPRIGNPVTSGSGSGWIYGNTPNDIRWP
jgi:uncharacterized repeat protein (TIGR02543 family)